MGRRYALFLLRLALAAAAVGSLLPLSLPVLGRVIARAARDVVVLTSWLPHLAELRWAGDRFQSGTILAAGRLSIDPALSLLIVGLPVAFAAALPGLRTPAFWRRLLGVTLLSVAFAALMLAILADGKAAQEASRIGLELNPRWRDQLVRAAMLRAWDLGALLYPFAACAWLAWVGLLRPSPSPGSQPSVRSAGVRWIVAMLLVVVLAAADALASRRLQVPLPERYTRAVQMNPDSGPLVLLGARRYEEEQKYQKALQAYAIAAGYPSQREQAQQAIRRLQTESQPR